MQENPQTPFRREILGEERAGVRRGRSRPDTPDHGAVHSVGRVGQHGGMSQDTTRKQGLPMQDDTPKTATTATNPALGRSTVAKLPPDVREAVDKAIADGVTIDEITARIRAEGENCSRSAVGRYSQNYRAMMRQQQESDRFMTQWMKQYGERPQGQAGLILIETMRTMVIDTVAAFSERGEPVPMQELERLSRVVKRIEDTDKLRLAREQAAAKEAEAAKPKPESKPKSKPVKPKPKRRKGLSPETVALIDEAVLGKPRWPARTVTSVPVDPWNPAESLSISFNPGKKTGGARPASDPKPAGG